jgi:putative GTP pyrophosphokinase
MDFWASLEHKLRYKSSDEIKDDLQSQLKECAEQISLVDSQMQEIHEKIH